MANHGPEQVKNIERAIKDAVALDPLVSNLKLQDYLFKQGYKTYAGNPLAWPFIDRLRKKIRQELITKLDRAELIPDLAEVNENNRIIRERLLKIAFYNRELAEAGMPPPSYETQMAALTYLAKIKVVEFETKLQVGVYAKSLEGKKDKLPEAQRSKLHQVLRNWGMLPAEVREAVGIKKESKLTPDEKTARKNNEKRKADLAKRKQNQRIGSPSDARGSEDNLGGN
jgi:hypothetical protein